MGLINQAGGKAVGLTGRDGGMIRARRLQRTKKDPDSNIERVLDLGFVGEPEHVDVRVIHALTGSGLVPVIAPVGVGTDGQTYNINADTVAGATPRTIPEAPHLTTLAGLEPMVLAA